MCLVALLSGAAVALAPAPAGAQDVPGGVHELVSGLGQVTLGGVAVARDGSGGIVYSATVGGISHVYLARLLGGVLQPPQQLDTGVLAGATDPVISADTGGRLLIAFLSGSDLYVTDATSGAGALTPPQLLATDASAPAISMNLFGVGYLAYTATTSAGSSVDVEYFNGTAWTPASPEAMNVTPDDAGTGSGAPSIVAASDGVGIVAWGENGHVYSRRVWGTETSVETEQDDPATYAGLTEVSAGAPQVASGGDSSYPDIVFDETFSDGGGTVTRAMLTRLIAEDTGPTTAVDGITQSGLAGDDPQIAMSEYGRGLITAAVGQTPIVAGAATSGGGPTAPYGVAGTVLDTNGVPQATQPVGAQTNAAAPDPVPGVFGLITSALTWVADGGPGLGSVMVDVAEDGVDFSGPVALSSPANGPVQSTDGLAIAGDGRGDGIVAWVQGSPGALAIDTEQLYTPPGSPGLAPGRVEATTSRPTLAWNPAPEDWGPVTYTVSLDGRPVAQTAATAIPLGPLTDGTYAWQVTATNPAGQTSTSRAGVLVVDTYPPTLALRLSGPRRAGLLERAALLATDPPNPTEPGATASGVALVTLNWGDGTPTVHGPRLARVSHRYADPGVYRITASVRDHAGNLTTLTELIRVLP